MDTSLSDDNWGAQHHLYFFSVLFYQFTVVLTLVKIPNYFLYTNNIIDL